MSAWYQFSAEDSFTATVILWFSRVPLKHCGRTQRVDPDLQLSRYS